MSKSYSDLVKQAESAVASVKDPELRRAAFEKILDDLLTSPSKGVAAGKRGLSTRRTAKKTQAHSRQRGPRTYICEMKEDGFFAKPKTISEVKAELANRGHHIPLTSLSGPLQKLCQDKELRRQKAGDKGGKKKTFVYSNW
jgi:membrane protein involved in colicin uptake